MDKSSKWLIFSLVAVIQFLVVLDISIVNVALPTIQKALNFDQASLQWVVTAYALGFGGFLMLGGRAADLFGRKRVLLGGLIAFMLISLVIGFSQSAEVMVVSRALQGLAAAFMSPAALSTLLTLFEDGPERHRAMSIWTDVSTGGAAVGLLLGGLLAQYVDWRWNFLVNVPIGLILSYFIIKKMPAHIKEEKNHKLDLSGAALVTLGLITLVYALSEAPAWGWLSAKTLGMIGGGILLLIAFVWNETKVKNPLMPLSIFKIRNVVGANLMMLPITASMMGLFFLLSLYLSSVLGYSPLETGLAFLPFPILLSFVTKRVSRHVMRLGYKRFLISGIVVVGMAMAWLIRVPVENTSYWIDLLPAIIAMPIGMALIFMPLMLAATSGVPGHQAGLASGVVSTSQQMGGALGLAILTAVATSVTTNASNLPSIEAMVHGYQWAFIVATIFLALALLITLTIIKEPKHQAVEVPGEKPVVDMH